jgi:tetratricopeptide (TPR) repeat protein
LWGYRGYNARLPWAYGGYDWPLGPFYGSPFRNSLTIVSLAAPPPSPPVIVIQSPPTVIVEGRREPEVPPVTSGAPPPVPGPDEPGKDVVPPKPEKEKPPPPPRPQRKGAGEPKFPRLPGPEDDPRDEHARLVRAGLTAFADLEFGRAAQRFRQATRLRPEEHLPYFLLAQALLSQGNFHDAFDAISAGMRRRPDWPTSGFRPLDLYGRHVDEYLALVRSTEKALARHPLDPELLFLRGYVLWFDGRKEEARPYFRRALPGAANRADIERFQRALPDDVGL